MGLVVDQQINVKNIGCETIPSVGLNCIISLYRRTFRNIAIGILRSL